MYFGMYVRVRIPLGVCARTRTARSLACSHARTHKEANKQTNLGTRWCAGEWKRYPTRTSRGALSWARRASFSCRPSPSSSSCASLVAGIFISFSPTRLRVCVCACARERERAPAPVEGAVWTARLHSHPPLPFRLTPPSPARSLPLGTSISLGGGSTQTTIEVWRYKLGPLLGDKSHKGDANDEARVSYSKGWVSNVREVLWPCTDVPFD